MLSRGLIDVLPDEACLAAVIAHELAHIVLSHNIDTAYAFTDRLMLDDPDVVKRIKVARTRDEEESADTKAMELLKNSPYKDKLPRVGFVPAMLSARSGGVPHLIKPLLGNQMADSKRTPGSPVSWICPPNFRVRDRIRSPPFHSAREFA